MTLQDMQKVHCYQCLVSDTSGLTLAMPSWKDGIMPTHGLVGKESNRKTKVVAEEVAEFCKLFMDHLKQISLNFQQPYL
jgi:hypothetical protein